MDRCALFVDAGYVLADGAMAVHGTRRRESVSWDYGGLLQFLASLAMERSRLPLLRCYWYEATAEGQRSEDHEALADLPGVKLRVAKMWPGRREGAEIQRDLTTLARNKAVSDAMVVSAEENLAKVISDVQDMGMRVTLLNIAVDGSTTVSRALRQECDDIVEISSGHLRPYVELIAGAEPPRADERDDSVVALRSAGNGNGSSNGNGNGSSNGTGLAGYAATYAQPSSTPGAVQQATAPGYAAPAVADFADYPDFPEYPDYQRVPDQQENAEPAAADTGTPAETADGAAASPAVDGPAADYAPTDSPATASPATDSPATDNAGSEPAADYGTAQDYGQAAEQASAPNAPDAIAQEFAQPGPDQAFFRPETRVRQDLPSASHDRVAAHEAQQSRQDYGVRRTPPRPEPAPRAEPAAREELYAAPVAVPAAAEDLAEERQPTWPRQEADLLRSVESGYNPGAAREQFQADPVSREPLPGNGADRYQQVPVPVPAGSAQVRRLPTTRGPGHPGQPGQVMGQPEQLPGTPPAAPGLPGQPADNRGMGYQGPQGGPYGGPRPLGPVPGAPGGPGGPGGPSGFADQRPSGPPPAGPPIPMVPAGQPVPSMPGAGPMPGQFPAAGPAVQAPPAPGYSGGQSGVSLADAVQSAHEEGQAFGESVARDAPALWLEAVLARKPRMPSDLEARLLQGSALPIDFLLHDEVRHALRRGFWDALERARR